MAQKEEVMMYHKPVMLAECIEALQIKPDGTYVDVTFGGGGHSLKILEQLTEGRLIAFDQDEDAKRQADNIQSRSFTFCQANFRYMKQYLKLNGITKVNGILADLGISSHQIDSAERGFSTRFDGPLDMRMDPGSSLTASAILTTYSQEELQRIFSEYGEVSNARTLAAAIVSYRKQNLIETIAQFKIMLQGVIRGNPHKYLAQVFQALRIEVNQELSSLKDLLYQLPEAIKAGGRVAIISFHSLEDRLVKQFFRDGEPINAPDNPFSREEKQKPFFLITRKPIEPDENERISNPRSRSARLRVAEKS